MHGVTCGVLAILTIAGCKDPVKVSADPVTSPNVELTGPKKTLRLTVSPGPEAVSPTPVQVEIDLPDDWTLETKDGSASFFAGDEPMSAVHLVILGCGEGEMMDTCIARWKKTQEEDAGIRVGSSELRFEGPNGTWGVGFRRWLFGGSHGNILQCSASASKSHAGDLPRRKASCQTMRIVR